MLSSIFTAIGGNAALGWIFRRIPDWGGWVLGWLGGLLALFANLDPATQALVVTVLQGNWQEISLGSAIGFIIWALSQWRSWRATVKPHVVEPGNRRRELTEAEALALNNAETGLNQTHIPRR